MFFYWVQSFKAFFSIKFKCFANVTELTHNWVLSIHAVYLSCSTSNAWLTVKLIVFHMYMSLCVYLLYVCLFYISQSIYISISVYTPVYVCFCVCCLVCVYIYINPYVNLMYMFYVYMSLKWILLSIYVSVWMSFCVYVSLYIYFYVYVTPYIPCIYPLYIS